MKRTLLSIAMLASFGMCSAAETAQHEQHHTTAKHHNKAQHPHHAEIAKLHKEISEKTHQYETTHRLAKSNPRDSKLQNNAIEEHQAIQRLQTQVAALEAK